METFKALIVLVCICAVMFLVQLQICFGPYKVFALPQLCTLSQQQCIEIAYTCEACTKTGDTMWGMGVTCRNCPGVGLVWVRLGHEIEDCQACISRPPSGYMRLSLHEWRD